MRERAGPKDRPRPGSVPVLLGSSILGASWRPLHLARRGGGVSALVRQGGGTVAGLPLQAAAERRRNVVAALAAQSAAWGAALPQRHAAPAAPQAGAALPAGSQGRAGAGAGQRDGGALGSLHGWGKGRA